MSALRTLQTFAGVGRSAHNRICGQADLSFCDYIQCIDGYMRSALALSRTCAHLRLVTGRKIVQYQEAMDWPLQDNAHGKAAKRACSFSPEENDCDISIYSLSSGAYSRISSLG
ncbi:hypothetical protein [Marinobacterium sp. BA1]|uniref:hypothetical protein n=1 Tax=Marinobacterium sp. BA1 TaxID=3138931 RepID=UPI0034E8EA9C